MSDQDDDGIADFIDPDNDNDLARSVCLVRTGTGNLDPLLMLLIFVWGLWRFKTRIAADPQY